MSKKNLLLLLILCLLAGLAFGYKLWWLPKSQDSEQENNFLATIDFKQVDKISIKQAGKETILNKLDDSWQVQAKGDWRVNQLLIDTMEQAWQEVASNTMSLAGNGEEAKKGFKIDEGLVVSLFSGENQVGSWALGINRAGYTYISPSDSDKVYEVKGNLRSAFDYREWRNFLIWNDNFENFNKLKISRGREILSFVKKDGNWFLTTDNKIKLNQDKVRGIIMIMSGLNASSLPDDSEADLQLKLAVKIEASGEGVDNVLSVGQQKIVGNQPTGEFYIKTNKNNNLYLISQSQTKSLNVGLKDLQQ